MKVLRVVLEILVPVDRFNSAASVRDAAEFGIMDEHLAPIAHSVLVMAEDMQDYPDGFPKTADLGRWVKS